MQWSVRGNSLIRTRLKCESDFQTGMTHEAKDWRQGGTTSFRYVTRKRIITNIPIAHVIHRLYAGFLTDRHWTVVRNLKLRRGLLIVQLKASSILVQFIENDRNKV